MLLGIATGVLTSRGLGPEGKGTLTAILIGPFILTPILSLGVQNSNVYFINKYPTKGPSLFANSFWIVFAVSPVLVVLQFLIPILMHSYNSRSILIARVYLLMTLIGIFELYMQSLLRGLKKFHCIYVLRFLYPAMVVFLLLCFFKSGLTLIEACFSLILAGWVVLTVGIVSLRKYLKLSLTWDIGLLKESLAYGVKSVATSISNMAQLRLDQMIMVSLVSSLQLGLYSVAVRMSESLWHVANAVGTVLFPEISGKDSHPASVLIVRTLFITMIMLALIGGVLLIFASPIILFFFGEAFSGAIIVFRVLIMASVVMGSAKVLGEGLYGLGHPALLMYGSLLGLLINIVFLLILIPLYGIIGAGIASVIGYSCNFLALLLLFKRKAKLSHGFILKNALELSRMIVLFILKRVKTVRNTDTHKGPRHIT